VVKELDAALDAGGMCVNWKLQVQVLTAVRERRGLSVILYVKQPFVNLILDDAERKDVYL